MKSKRIIPSGRRAVISSLVAAAVVILLSVVGYFELRGSRISDEAAAEFHFIDVGQGDAAMILTHTACVVIDCGPTSASEAVTDYIGRYTDRIDCLVFSHPHEDHMGASSAVLKRFPTERIIMTEYASDASFFSRTLDVIEENDIAVTEAAVGETYIVGDIALRVLSPSDDFGDMNNNSIVMRVDAGGTSALFTGDAETEAEEVMLSRQAAWLPCDILKVGHHGSSTSSSDSFISAVSPQLAVISCGSGNSYGHPHLEVLRRLEQHGAEYHRTDIDGSIVIESSSDGIRKTGK